MRAVAGLLAALDGLDAAPRLPGDAVDAWEGAFWSGDAADGADR